MTRPASPCPAAGPLPPSWNRPRSSHWLGRRATLTAGMLANGSSLIALGYVTAAPAVITMTFAAGATIDMYRPAAQALVADLIPAACRARAFGLISWAANLGFSAAMLSGGMLAQAGFQWLFWADALTCAAFATLAWRAMPRTPARPAARAKEAGGFGDVLRDRVMAGFLLVVLGQMAVYQQGFTTLPIAMHAGGLPPRAYGLVMVLNGVVIVAVQPLAGNWLGQRDHSLVIVAGNALLGAGFAVTSLASSLWPTAAPCASGRSARSPSPQLAAPSPPIWPPRICAAGTWGSTAPSAHSVRCSPHSAAPCSWTWGRPPSGSPAARSRERRRSASSPWHQPCATAPDPTMANRPAS